MSCESNRLNELIKQHGNAVGMVAYASPYLRGKSPIEINRYVSKSGAVWLEFPDAAIRCDKLIAANKAVADLDKITKNF